MQKFSRLRKALKHFTKKICRLVVMMLLMSLLVISVRRHACNGDRFVVFPLYSTDEETSSYANDSRWSGHNSRRLLTSSWFRSDEENSFNPVLFFDGELDTKTGRAYYLKLKVGEHGRTFNLNIDTGSSFTWLFCKWHDDTKLIQTKIEGPNGLYDPKKHQSKFYYRTHMPKYEGSRLIKREINPPSKFVEYTVEVQYIDDTKILSVLVKEEIQLTICYDKSNTKPIRCTIGFQPEDHLKIGCTHTIESATKTVSNDRIHTTFNLQDGRYTRYDGILGCDRGQQAFQSQLKDIGAISCNAVVFCFKKETDRTKNPSGYVVFGLPKILTKDFMWSPLVFPKNWKETTYQVHVKRISILGQLMIESENTISPNYAVLDTGQNSMLLTESIANLIKERMTVHAKLKGYKEAKTFYGASCWYMERDVDPEKDFDDIELYFASDKQGDSNLIPFKLHPHHYLKYKGFLTKRGERYMCLRMTHDEITKPAIDGVIITLGGATFAGRILAFDNEKKRFGWKSSTCDEEFPPKKILMQRSFGQLDESMNDVPWIDEPILTIQELRGTKRPRPG